MMDPAYAAALRRWSRRVVPSWAHHLIHTPRCYNKGDDPTCSACKALQAWYRRAHEDTL